MSLANSRRELYKNPKISTMPPKNQPVIQKIVTVVRVDPNSPKKPEICVEDFKRQCVEAHNKYRALHGCPPLTLNEDISAFAKEWAENLARRDGMEHRPNNTKYGENIYKSDGMQVDGELPVRRWYDEIKQYNFSKSEWTPYVGHFTQVVWKESREVGIGLVRKGEKTYVVANYSPPGNIQGQFKEMVPRLIK